MKVIVLSVALFMGIQLSAQTVTLKLKNEPLLKVFLEVERQTGYSFVYTKSQLDSARKVTINVHNVSLQSVLDQCMKNQRLSYHIQDNQYIVIETRNNEPMPVSKEPEIIALKGKVTDPQGTPLSDVSIIAKGTLYGTSTDLEGNFEFEGIYGKVTLIVSHIGYKTEELPLNNRKTLTIKLEPQEGSLDNVVISTGYQKIEQKHLTGAVTSLKMDSIYQPGLTTVDKMLEGRVPGMIFMQNSGQPGAAPKLRVRGTSTLLGTQEPLWVVDGIVQTDPVPVSADKINNLDFVNLVGNAISGINPNDIEQIDVLKDAAATALYGVRAANGVIVITTKRGKSGPPVINYQVSGTYTRRPRYTDKEVYMMNSKERVDVSREFIEKQIPLWGTLEGYEKTIIDYYNGSIDYDTYQNRLIAAETMNTDWFKAITNDVFATNHNLGISGGTQVSRYYASVSYTDEKGVIKGEFNKRYTGQVKFDVNYKNFKAQFSIMANRNSRKYIPDELNILNYAYSTSRAIPLYNPDGSLYYYRPMGDVASAFPSFNVLNEMNHSGQTLDGNTYLAIADLNYQLIPGLQLNVVLSYQAGNTEQRAWFDEKTNWVHRNRVDPGSTERDRLPFGGELRQQTNQQKQYNIRTQANYSSFIDRGQRHQINATLGGEMSSTSNSGMAQIRRGYYPDRGYSFADIDLAVYPGYAQWLRENGQAKITEDLTNLISAYLTASYIFNDRYILSGTLRSDFSNAFGTRSNERFLPTWGISGRWNMDRDILKNSKWVNLASLRFSWGSQGNMLPNQTPYTIIQKGPMDSYYGAFGSTVVAFPNPGLQWEKTNSYNAGLDFSLFNNRLRGSVAYFYKKTSNAFLTKSVSLINGVNQYIINAGTLENKGVELALNFTPIDNIGSGGNKGGLVWRIDPQLGQVFNKLLNRTGSNGNVLVDVNGINYRDFLNGTIPVNGKAVNTFYAYRFRGLDHNTGQPVFYGAEPENKEALYEKYWGMKKEEVFKEVMVEVGKREPVIQGGIGNYFGYKNWSFNFMLSYSLGNKIRLLRIASGDYSTYAPTSQQNLRKEFVDRWRYPGDEKYTTIPGIQTINTITQAWWQGMGLPVQFATDYYQMYDDADIRVVSGNYLKLQSIDLSYNFSAALCSQLRIKAARVSLAGTNLFTLANKALRGQDPSQSGTSPGINLSIRPVYSFNVNVSF
ncbi:SusC/RagA family TonB-linked outer membrane protein [Niabella beijingensis]|uniref:SusC/RagA family TonB-linked outer membrane protein n=1 Tax=Niabella beijingensis TaxID=2872700 RepID=UPI001CC183D8|nr:SusC/RagA family TonB-linked outer membrane protein [Niabella beijingensis]MBZ4189377.1 SusC/RagA family TonB-linked outer membrane protein [Niabella beijingensis]